jgi:hypothetical protein
VKTRLRRIVLEIEDMDAPGSVMQLEVCEATHYGWDNSTGANLPLFPRYLDLMSKLSEFLKEEKK